MLVWVENAPTLETKSEEEIIEFVDQYLTCSSDNEKTANLLTFKVTNILEPAEKKGNQYVGLDFHCHHCRKLCCCILLRKTLTSTRKRM